MSNSADFERRVNELSAKLTAGEIDDDEYKRKLAVLQRAERAAKSKPNPVARPAPRAVTSSQAVRSATRAPLSQPTPAASTPQPVLLWCAVGGTLCMCCLTLAVVAWFVF